MSGRPAVFLDRDGTLIEDHPYLNDVRQLTLYPFSAKAVRLLNEDAFSVILITNQSGVGRGLISQEQLENIHQELSARLQKQGARLDAIYVCPHAPDEGCDCRKPAPGLLLEAADKFRVNLRDSYMVGDKDSDVRAAMRVGARPILVQTGQGAESLAALTDVQGSFDICADLLEAVQWIQDRAN